MLSGKERQARLDDCKESARVVCTFYTGLEARCLASNIEWLLSEVERLEKRRFLCPECGHELVHCVLREHYDER